MSLKHKICVLANKFRRGYRIIATDEVPEELQKSTVYVVGSADHPQYAFFSCPCGCGRRVDLNLNPDTRPCWQITWHLTGTISFAPSIWRKDGCRSHFFFKRNRLYWVN